MHRSETVVPRKQPLTEQAFRAKWLRALARMCDQHGDDHVALWLGVTDRHLRNLKAGNSLPSADRIWNLLTYDDSAHDELDAAFGLRNVHEDSVCTTDPLTLDMIALAHETAEHEHPQSAGGVATTDHELLGKDEARLRKIHRTIGTWLDRIERLRAPSMRIVG